MENPSTFFLFFLGLILCSTVLDSGVAGFTFTLVNRHPSLTRMRTAATLTETHPSQSRRPCSSRLLLQFDSDLPTDEDDDDEAADISDQDWRAFRAKLVMSSNAAMAAEEEGGIDVGSTSLSGSSDAFEDDDVDGIGALFGDKASTAGINFQFTPLDPSQWAYESGNVIEQGAVILGGVEQEFGFGLRQQYFHKAAILVLDHDERQFTKGIILNRPSDLLLDDDINPGVKWRVWFGGDVQGIGSTNCEICCLHSMSDEQVRSASVSVMNDIQWTTFENAKRLVKVGAAKPTDFWLFAGYAGWGAGQLMGELERKSWYMVATDPQTLLKELAQMGAGADPREAGLDTWNLLMNMIGRKETAEDNSGGFDDLMLKEWALTNLLSIEAGGGANISPVDGGPMPAEFASLDEPAPKAELVDVLLDRVRASARAEEQQEVVEVGTLVRASSKDRSPFLLNHQELHKSVVLIVMDDETLTVGVILNRPAAKGLDIDIKDRRTTLKRTATVPLRYGGQYAVRNQEPLLWLHCNPMVKTAGIGQEIGSGTGGKVWKCTTEEVSEAIGRGLASPSDFIVVSGVTVWTKGEGSDVQGMQGEVRNGHFEVIPDSQTEVVWNSLLKQQEVLDKANYVENLSLASEAWVKGTNNGKGRGNEKQGTNREKLKNTFSAVIGGLGEQFDEEDDTLVYNSDVRVADLSDKALRSWVATYLLGEPGLGVE